MISEEDLMELAGFWSYELHRKDQDGNYYYSRESYFKVNGKTYAIIDIYSDQISELQSAIVADETGNTVVLYQGSSESRDWLTNAQLIGNNTPAQFNAAIAYYEDSANKIADFNSNHGTQYKNPEYVVGNSLGGGLSNYTASKYPNKITSVTIDPAPCPAGVKLTKNARSYVSFDNSPLYLLCSASGLYDDRFPGEFININNGFFDLIAIDENGNIAINFEDCLRYNHVGYSTTSQGQGIDDSLPFSIWQTGLLSKKSKLKAIEINHDTIEQLTLALQNHISEMVNGLMIELDPVYEIINEEGKKLDNRQRSIDMELSTLLTDALTSTVSTISKTINEINLAGIETIGHIFAYAFTSLPKKLVTWLSKEGIPDLFKPMGGGANKIENNKLWNPFVDSYVAELESHHLCIENNLHKTKARLDNFLTSTISINNQMKALDKQIAKGDFSGIHIESVESTTLPLQYSTVFDNLKSAIDKKQKLLDENYAIFTKGLSSLVLPALRSVSPVLRVIKLGLEWKKNSFTNSIAYNQVQISILKGETTAYNPYQNSLYMEYEHYSESQKKGRIYSLENQIKAWELEYAKVEEWYVLVSDTYPKLISYEEDNFTEVLMVLKPYVNNALFATSKYSDIQNKCYKAKYHCENMVLMFNEIHVGIQENKSAAIQALDVQANSVLQGLKRLIKDLEIILIH